MPPKAGGRGNGKPLTIAGACHSSHSSLRLSDADICSFTSILTDRARHRSESHGKRGRQPPTAARIYKAAAFVLQKMSSSSSSSASTSSTKRGKEPKEDGVASPIICEIIPDFIESSLY